MLIDPMNAGRTLCQVFFLCAVAVLSPPGSAQEGQYRSKIRIDPLGDTSQGAGLSIEELEQQINSIAEPYARSSAGRHLARHFVEQGEYDKAIEYYQSALTAKGLSDIANREMLRELAQVYLLKEDYAAAAGALERALRINLVAEATDYLLLAQAYYRQGKLVQVVAALDPIDEKGLNLTLPQKRQALALYYQAGAYAQCERLLRELLHAEPDNADNWHHLASVFLQQGKKKQALDQLALAWEKSVPFREQDIILLADLHAVNGNPYGAAVVLDAALKKQTVTANGLNYRKLFQFWLQAREQENAVAALIQAARLSGDIELYLYLAQLQMEQEAWDKMYETMLAACKNTLQDKYVGRANLLLGISQLKLGDESSARRSFINASLIGGAGPQAGQWLTFMNAEPPTPGELRRIVGVCHGPKDKGASADEFTVAAKTADADGSVMVAARSPQKSDVSIATKTVPQLKFFYQEYKKPLSELAGEAKSLAMKMGIAMVKSGGSVDGPLQVIALGTGADSELQLGFPARGAPRAGGKYDLRVTRAFKCAYVLYEGKPGSLEELWANFLSQVAAAGHVLTDERRVILQAARGDSAGSLELQVGIE
jgi:tetratricopeptide (TPR) repeat protein